MCQGLSPGKVQKPCLPSLRTSSQIPSSMGIQMMLEQGDNQTFLKNKPKSCVIWRHGAETHTRWAMYGPQQRPELHATFPLWRKSPLRYTGVKMKLTWEGQARAAARTRDFSEALLETNSHMLQCTRFWMMLLGGMRPMPRRKLQAQWYLHNKQNSDEDFNSCFGSSPRAKNWLWEGGPKRFQSWSQDPRLEQSCRWRCCAV